MKQMYLKERQTIKPTKEEVVATVRNSKLGTARTELSYNTADLQSLRRHFHTAFG